MPIFEFQCRDCEHTFEEWFRTSRHAIQVVCPQCQSRNVVKLLSLFGVQTRPARTCPYESTAETLPCRSCGKQSPAPCSLDD